MVNPHADYDTGTTYGPAGSGITSLPPSQNFGSNIQIGGSPIVDTKVQQEQGEGDYLNQTLPGQSDTGGNDGGMTYGDLQNAQAQQAYNESLIKQQQMADAKKLADQYGTRINQLTDQQLLDMQASGLFEAQAEGMLGGVTNREKRSNLLKKAIGSVLDKAKTMGLSGNQIADRLDQLPEFQLLLKDYGGNVDALMANFENPNLGYDKTSIYSHTDVQTNPELKTAYEALTGGDLTADELRQFLPFIDYQTFEQNPGVDSNRFRFGAQARDDRLRMLRMLQGAGQIKPLEQQGFFDTMKDAYSEDMARAADEGIFKGILGAGVFDSDALKRLIRSYGSGVAQPRYTNVARGGIISLVGA
tara:strand:- start:121 stop:1197 length:1077 start_codon:yes stop_codon:yes gene_type:complete